MAEGYESSSPESVEKRNQVPSFGGLKSQNGNVPMFPMMYPALVPGLLFPQQDQEQINHGPGLYAVQTIAGFPSKALIPFTYNIPTERSSPDTSEVVGEQPQAVPQRQVIVRRFHIAIHLDLFLIIKLAAVIFLFNHDGSKARLTLLVFLAALIYLYQTGVLAPVVRWLSQGMQRAAAPPQPHVRPENNIPAVQGQGNQNEDRRPDDDNENPAVEGGEDDVVNNRWWGIVKEIKMIVFGFVTSLLPGFHNLD